jgi:hypothetical protein
MSEHSTSENQDMHKTPGAPGVVISEEANARNIISAYSGCVVSTQGRVSNANTRSIEQSANEVWRQIPGFDGYEASTWGHIRSVDRTLELVGRWGPMKRFHQGKILRLRPKPNGSGLTYLCFYAGGGSYPQVNRAVCWTFHGRPPSERHEAAHLDGRTENNRPENLAWKTPTENAADKVRHGTAPIGVKNARARLDEAIVADIIDRYAVGEKSLNLAMEHHVTVCNILAVVRGDTWTHVKSWRRESAKSRCRANMLEASRRANAKRAAHAARR